MHVQAHMRSTWQQELARGKIGIDEETGLLLRFQQIPSQHKTHTVDTLQALYKDLNVNDILAALQV